jgi:hypothetical protein
MSISIDLLQVFTDISPDIIDIYTELFGLPCDIFEPIKEDRLFDDHAKPKYPTTPTETGRTLLIVNFIKSTAMRGNSVQFDSFFGDGEERPYIITHDLGRLPPRTKINAYFKNAKMSFETEIDMVITGVKAEGSDYSNILIKQILRPLT